MLIGKFAPTAHFYTDTDANDARCAREVKSRAAMAKEAFKKTTTVMTSTLNLNRRKKLVKCYIGKYIFVWCQNLDTYESRTEIPGKF